MSTVTIKKSEVFNIIKGDLSFDIPPCAPLKQDNIVAWKPSEIRSFLKKNLVHFQQNTLFIKETFYEAIKESQSALELAIHKDADYMYEYLNYKSAVIINDTGLCCFYSIDSESKTITFLVTHNGNPVYGVCKQGLVIEKSTTDGIKFYLNSSVSYIQDFTDVLDDLNSCAYFGLMTSFFRTYANHEAKIVSHKSSVNFNGTVYKNLNKCSVTILDSTWYTSITRTEGFMVRGHLRMQPCGPNMSERKLIYIDSFEKHGYTRKARMLPRSNPSISTITEALYE